MKNIILLSTLLLIGYVYEVVCNPCDGELFSLGCKMFEMAKKNAETEKKELNKRFSGISDRHRNDTKETRLMVDEGVQIISQKHNDDIKMVTEAAEEKFKMLKHLLDVKINETSGKEVNKTLAKLADEISTLKRNFHLEINNSTAFYKKGLQDLQTIMKRYLYTFESAFEREFLHVKEHVNETYAELKTKIDDIVKDQGKLEKRIDSNTAGYKKGISDLTSNLETYKNTTKRDLKTAIEHVEREVDKKYVSLKKDVDETISKTAEDLKKTIEKKAESRFEGLEKELSTNISKLEDGLKKTIESDVEKKYEKMKEEVSVEIIGSMKGTFDRITQSIEDVRKEIKSKGWPDGHYCLYMWGRYCPDGFSKIYNHYHWYCCK